MRHKAKTLSDDERRQLLKIPGMKDRLQEWDDPQGLNAFATHIEEVLKFVRRNKHLPKVGSENMEEKRCAEWLYNLQRRNKAKPLSDDRRRQLNRIPGMKDRLQRWDDFQGFKKSFATHVEEVIKFVRRNKHLPRPGSENGEERRSGTWLYVLQRRNKAKPLSDDERRQLSTIPGMKDRLQRWDDRL